MAWRFTQARELIEHRSIDKTGFIDTYARIYENLAKLSQFDQSITTSLIIKQKDNKIGDLREGVQDILQEIPPRLTRIELEKLLQ